MKPVLSLREHGGVRRFGIILITAALVAGTMSCVYYTILNVSSTPGGEVRVPGENSFTYEPGTVVPLKAVPHPGFQFLVWTGDIGTVANEHAAETTITMNGNYSIKAIFCEYPAPKVVWQSPLYDERFLRGEPVQFRATVEEGDGSQLQWASDLDGFLGTGTVVSTPDLSVGEHSITASITVRGYQISATQPVRVFADLGDLYVSQPAQGEIQRILHDFTFEWVTGTGVDEDWSAYDSFDFDQTSTDPSKLVIIARLDVLRRQRFSEPLPMTGGDTIYDHLRTHVHTIRLRLDCGYNIGGGGRISLNRSGSVWDARLGGTCESFTPPWLQHYVHPLQLLVHEARHSMPCDPGHTDCGLNGPHNKDHELEGGSGYAWGAMYYMWVYKYSLYDPPDIKDSASEGAYWLLISRFCTTPSHSNPLVDEIIDELLTSSP